MLHKTGKTIPTRAELKKKFKSLFPLKSDKEIDEIVDGMLNISEEDWKTGDSNDNKTL